MNLARFDPAQYLLESMRSGVRSARAEGNARVDPYAFLQAILVDEKNRSIPIDNFTRIFFDSWLYCWNTRQTSGRRHFAFTSPPGLGKSTLARMGALFALAQDRDIRIAVTSGSVSDSTNVVSLCRAIVLSPAYQKLFPTHQADAEESMTGRGWKQSEWFLKTDGQRKDPTMRAMSSTPKMESARIDLLLADDVITQRTFDNSEGVAIAEAFKKTFIEGRLRLGGVAMYLQNLRGKNDLLHQLREWPKFISVWVGVTADCERMFLKGYHLPDDFPLLDEPERYGLAVKECPDTGEDFPPHFYAEFDLPVRPGYTKEDLRDTEPGAFQAMFRLQGVDETNLMMPGFKDRERAPGLVSDLLQVENVGGLVALSDADQFRFAITAGLDISGAQRKGMAFCVVAETGLKCRIVLELWTIQGGLDETFRRIDDAWRRGLRWRELAVESNGVQSTLREALRTFARFHDCEWARTITGTVTGANKWDPQLGLPGLDMKFQNKVYLWPDGMSKLKNEVGEFWRRAEAEWSILTRQVTRSTTPDDLMALWFADSALDRRRVASKFKPLAVKKIGGDLI